jgi:hypothetical protein
MKKSFMNNLKNFVDSNVRQRIDRVTHTGSSSNSSDLLSDDLQLVERHFDDLRQFCVDAEKKISNLLCKSLCKSASKLKQDSLLATILTHCSKLQTQLTNLHLFYEQMIDTQCLKPIEQMLEVDIPNVLKLKKSYIKANNDLESIRTKYNGASHKQQLQAGNFNNTSYLVTQGGTQQSSINKLELLKNELDESISRFEQAKVSLLTNSHIVAQ